MRLGGLGPNMNEEWRERHKKLEMMQEFARKVKIESGARLQGAPKRRKEPAGEMKEKSSRDKALEFAKNIPKPKVKSDPSAFGGSTAYQEYAGMQDEFKYSELEQLDQKHNEYQDEIEKIKNMFK